MVVSDSSYDWLTVIEVMIQWQLQRPWLVVSDSSYELCIRRNAGWYLIVFQIWVCRKKENLLSPSHQRVYCHLHHQCCLRVCKEYDPHKNHTCFLYKVLWNKMLYDQILSSELKANTSLICFHQRRKSVFLFRRNSLTHSSLHRQVLEVATRDFPWLGLQLEVPSPWSGLCFSGLQ